MVNQPPVCEPTTWFTAIDHKKKQNYKDLVIHRNPRFPDREALVRTYLIAITFSKVTPSGDSRSDISSTLTSSDSLTPNQVRSIIWFKGFHSFFQSTRCRFCFLKLKIKFFRSEKNYKMIFERTYDTYKFAWWRIFSLFKLSQIWRFSIRQFSNFNWLIFDVFWFWSFACWSWKTTNCRIFLESVLNGSNFRQWALK